ncbi:hypothetical protein [Acidiphilium acidophilum]|uniref:Uncharacterized protein n=1 Tax=Acidiphilium acidophilum TaxID=76588 RepID=A0AAW9DW62_ACIAO|nr:hypothetical protein [Acidiphilium acidophilum]MDX5932527.1 hypothetical protein [Acidiphilium acidophilum]
MTIDATRRTVPAGLAAGAGAAALPAISFDNVVTTPAALKVDTDQVEFGRPFRRQPAEGSAGLRQRPELTWHHSGMGMILTLHPMRIIYLYLDRPQACQPSRRVRAMPRMLSKPRRIDAPVECDHHRTLIS